jgi:hypothetical protein
LHSARSSRPHNPWVVGSSPTRPTSPGIIDLRCLRHGYSVRRNGNTEEYFAYVTTVKAAPDDLAVLLPDWRTSLRAAG